MSEPTFSQFHLALGGVFTSLEFEDDVPAGPLVDVLRELSRRLEGLADYYEEVGTDELFEPSADDEGTSSDDESDDDAAADDSDS